MDNWVIEGSNEWKQIEGGYNWYTFTLIHIYGEKSWGGYEFWFTFLGLGVYIRYNTKKSNEIFNKWEEELDTLEK